MYRNRIADGNVGRMSLRSSIPVSNHHQGNSLQNGGRRRNRPLSRRDGNGQYAGNPYGFPPGGPQRFRQKEQTPDYCLGQRGMCQFALGACQLFIGDSIARFFGDSDRPDARRRPAGRRQIDLVAVDRRHQLGNSSKQ